jgi:hypothetical protein
LGEGIRIPAPFSFGRRAGLRRERSAERDEDKSLLYSAVPNFTAFVDSTTNFSEKPAGILSDGTNLQDFLAANSLSHTIGSVEFIPDGAL